MPMRCVCPVHAGCASPVRPRVVVLPIVFRKKLLHGRQLARQVPWPKHAGDLAPMVPHLSERASKRRRSRSVTPQQMERRVLSDRLH